MAGDENKPKRLLSYDSAITEWKRWDCLAGNKLLSDIRIWLIPPDPWKNYNIARESRHGETGAWFVNSTTVTDWKESGHSSLLWIHGKRQLQPISYSFADTDSHTLL
jgi:hypothetical protein